MDFLSIILFLGLYYVRPQEWIPFVGMLQLISVSLLMAMLSLFIGERSLGWKDFFRTPLDWLMAALIIWMVFASPSGQKWRTFQYVYNLYVFYWVTVITLRDALRMQSFLTWWAVFIVFVAGLAVLSEYGFDPTFSYDLTHGRMKDRLTLNLGIFNNPNALGHSVVPGVVMLYFIAIWKRPFFSRITAPLMMALPVFCIYLTLSKGAFLSGFATLVSALSFKRPKAVQIAILVLVGTFGIVAIKALPRMQELQSSKSDEAIQGRVHAFQFGYEMMQNNFYGIGYANFLSRFTARFHYGKAAHSTYVNVGSELGKTGLFIYLGMIYFGYRILLAAKTTTDEEERVRRCLFVLLLSFCISSWMISWHNRATFWLMIACIAAFHRLMLDKHKAAVELGQTETPEITPLPGLAYATPNARPVGMLNQIALPARPAATTNQITAQAEDTPPDAAAVGMIWNRPKWYDWLAIYACLVAVIAIWKYAMEHM